MAEPTMRIFGRPALAPEQRKSEVVATRLRPNEFDIVERRARAAGFENVTDFARNLLLSGTVQVKK